LNRRLATLVVAAGAIGAFAFVLPSRALPPGTSGYNKSYDTVIDCGNGNTLTFHAPTNLWPPNHKYYTDIYVLAKASNSADKVDLATDGTHNQYDGDTEANGSGHTADDIAVNDADGKAMTTPSSTATHPAADETGTGSVLTNWEARAERAGTLSDGRTYTLNGTATFTDANGKSTSCNGSVQMVVPHDMRPSNR
jgi:hypothetical protein